jgi:hypothetical protein
MWRFPPSRSALSPAQLHLLVTNLCEIVMSQEG